MRGTRCRKPRRRTHSRPTFSRVEIVWVNLPTARLQGCHQSIGKVDKAKVKLLPAPDSSSGRRTALLTTATFSVVPSFASHSRPQVMYAARDPDSFFYSIFYSSGRFCTASTRHLSSASFLLCSSGHAGAHSSGMVRRSCSDGSSFHVVASPWGSKV